MNKSSSLFYAFSENSSQSKWMPWELGYFDALKEKVAVLPISQSNKSNFVGTEYLGLYYYVDIERMKNTEKEALWVQESTDIYIRFDLWIKSKEAKPYKH